MMNFYYDAVIIGSGRSPKKGYRVGDSIESGGVDPCHSRYDIELEPC